MPLILAVHTNYQAMTGAAILLAPTNVRCGYTPIATILAALVREQYEGVALAVIPRAGLSHFYLPVVPRRDGR